MKKTTLMAVSIGLLSTIVYGKLRDENAPCEKLEKFRLVMKDSLHLTNDQDFKIKALNDTACAQFQAAFAKANGNKEALKESKKTIVKNTMEAYKSILTPSQLTKFKSMHKGKKHREFNADKRAENLTEKMEKELALTPEQVIKVKAANLEMVNRMHGLMEKKAAGTDSSELKKMHKLIHKEYKQKMAQILTTEQLEKLKNMKKERASKPEKESKGPK